MEKLMNNEPDNMKTLLANTIYMMCKDGFSFTRRLTIKGLIVVSVDDEAFIVQMDKKFCHSDNGEVVAACDHDIESAEDNEELEHTQNSEDDASYSNGEMENGEPHHQVPVHQKVVIRPLNKSHRDDNTDRSTIKEENGLNTDVTDYFLESFSTSAIKLETTSDNEDACEFLASINTDYNGFLKQENETSAISSNSSPLHIAGVVSAQRHAPSSASSTSSQCNAKLGKLIKKDVFNYDDEGRRLKSFECQYEGCAKAFFRKDHLTRHQRIKHGKPYGVESQNVYKCCGKTFYKHRSLLKHVKETHPDSGDTSVLLVVHGDDSYEHQSNGHSQAETDTTPMKSQRTAAASLTSTDS